MKKPILILISLLLLTGVSESKEVSYLHERNGIKYEVNSEEPFSGTHIEYDENGQRRTTYRNGKPKGLFTTWFKNGHRQKEYEGYLNNRNREGLWTWWYENGQKREEIDYRNSKKEGLSIVWYENGQKEYEGNFIDGKKEGLWTYWYKKNGQKKFEGNLIDGKKEGLCTWWDKEGNVTETEIYKDDELVD